MGFWYDRAMLIWDGASPPLRCLFGAEPLPMTASRAMETGVWLRSFLARMHPTTTILVRTDLDQARADAGPFSLSAEAVPSYAFMTNVYYVDLRDALAYLMLPGLPQLTPIDWQSRLGQEILGIPTRRPDLPEEVKEAEIARLREQWSGARILGHARDLSTYATLIIQHARPLLAPRGVSPVWWALGGMVVAGVGLWWYERRAWKG